MSDKNWVKVLELVPLLGVAIAHAKTIEQSVGEEREEAIENLVDALVVIAETATARDFVDNVQLRNLVRAVLDLRPVAPVVE